MKLKIVALGRYKLAEIKKVLGVGNRVRFECEYNKNGTDYCAYGAYAHGVFVGWLPEARSVREKWNGDRVENEVLADAIDYIRLKKPQGFSALVCDLNVRNTSSPWIEVEVIGKKKRGR